MIYDTLPLTKSAAMELMVTVMSRYTEPHRRFHTLEHLENLFAYMNWYKKTQGSKLGGWLNEDLLALSILFHDIVYVPGSKENEIKSAKIAVDFLRRNDFRQASIDTVERIILATQTHQMEDNYAMDPMVALFLDMDLAGLGSDPVEYRRTSSLVADEFTSGKNAFSVKAFWEGRQAWLEGMLNRPQIYNHPEFVEAFERQAKENISEEILKIKSFRWSKR